MAHRTRRQLEHRRRIERVIRLAAPGLDLLLFVGHHVARYAGRNEADPEPAGRPAGPEALERLSGARGGG